MANQDISVDVVAAIPQTIQSSARFIDTTTFVSPELYIGGTLVNDKFMYTTGRCELQLNGRGTMGAVLTNPTKDYRPSEGLPVLLKNNGITLFAGVLNRFEEYSEGAQQGERSVRRFKLEAIDYGGSLDRRFITGHLKNSTLSLQTIIGNLFIGNRILTSPNPAESDIADLIFVPLPTPIVPGEPRHVLEACAQVCNRYSDASGYSYFVDENRVMLWRDHAAAPDPAPWAITDDAAGRARYQSLNVHYDLSQYANLVWVRTNLSLSSTFEDTFTGDSSTKVFQLRAIPSDVISVTVNGVAQSFGTLEEKLGLDDSCISTLPQTFKQWYYFPPSDCLGFGTINIEQHDSETPLTSSDTLSVTYRGPVSNFAKAEDTADQAVRQAEEGGTGIYEAVFEQKNLADEEQAQAFANALLAKHMALGRKINLRTQKHGLRPGHTINVVNSEKNLNGDFLIQRVSIDFTAGKLLQYDAELVSTQLPIPRPEQFLEKLVEMARGGSDPFSEASSGSGAGPATGGGTGSIVWERPRGLVDGTNDTFYSSFIPQELETENRSIIVFRAGQVLSPFDDEDYAVTVSEGKLVYPTALIPKSSDDHHILYLKKGGQSIGNPAIGARLFEGSPDIIDWGAHAEHYILGDLSIGMWFKLNSSSADGQTLITRGAGTGNITQYGLQLSDQGGEWGILYFHDDASNNVYEINFDLDLLEGVWYYGGISRDSTLKTVMFHLGDGEDITRTLLGTYVIPPGGSDTGTRNLGVGGGFGTFGGAHLQATVQESYISSRTIPWTKAEHALAMKGSPPSSGLVHSSRLLGNSPEVEESSTGATGTPTGTRVVPGRI